MGLMVAVVQWELCDVAARVRDPADGRQQEDDPEDDHENPGERDADDRDRQRRGVDERDDARSRHVDLLPDGRDRAVVVDLAHYWMYTNAATKVRANIRTPTMLAKKAV